MPLTVVGANHTTAPIDVRERFHVGEERLGEVLGRTAGRGGVRECLLLSTCNRTELYLDAEGRSSAVEAAESLLSEESGLPREGVSRYLYRRHGREAARHLFRVASGLDSLVLGEVQIQGQVSEAYETGRREAPEVLGPTLHRLFQTALSAGGRVRAETGLSEGAASIPSAAVELASKVFGSLEGRRAVVVGAGEMGRLTLEALRGEGVEVAMVVSRTLERASEAADRVAGTRPVSYEEVWRELPGVDIVLTSTSAPHYVVTADRIRSARGGDERPLVVVDIALPRDVEPAAGDLPGVFLYNIDDLQRVVREAERARTAESEAAEELVEAEADEFWGWYLARDAVPLIRGIRERAERIRREEMEEALEEVDGLTDEERERILRASRLVLRKVLHAPTVGLRDVARQPDGGRLLELARRLFSLPARRDGASPEEGASARPPARGETAGEASEGRDAPEGRTDAAG